MGNTFSYRKSGNGAHQLSCERAGKKIEPYSRERLEENIDICLNFDRAKCTGRCKKILESRKEIARERKAQKTYCRRFV